MRYGICCSADWTKLEKLKEYGYDYAEIPLCEIADWSESEIEKYLNKSRKTGIYAEAVFCFFKYGESYLVKPGIDYKEVENYIETALSKAQRLGVKVAVIGSGGARRIPDGLDYESATAQFVRVFALSAQIAEKYGITVVIEPLSSVDTNFINTVEQGIEICKKTDLKNAKVLADFYHVAMTGEGLETVENCGDMLAHLHIARANPDRKMPISHEDMPFCKAVATAVKKNGYNGRISLEGDFGEDWDKTAIKMREILKVFD